MNKLFNNKNLKQTRRSLRKTMPKSEKMLGFRLRANKVGYKFRRQYAIENYIVDFYCPKLKLAIEIDGKTHDLPDLIKYDKQRQEYLESLGIQVKRFYSEDIFEDLDYVVERIKNVCNDLKKRLTASY